MDAPLIKYIRVHILIALMITPVYIWAQEVDHWETIIQTGQSVKYLVPQGPLPPDWDEPEFDDSGWTPGIAGIGYGDEDDITVIDPCISVYVRYRFSLTDPGAIAKLVLDMDFDDSFVAYLNGHEVARENIGEAFSATSWDQLSDAIVEELPEGSYRYKLSETDVDRLLTGENFFCVEVHNQSAESSDLSSNAFLHAGISNASSYFSEPPAWFFPPVSFDTHLPIMVINTKGQNIPNEPRIIADMGIVYNGKDQTNNPEDTFNIYDGKIAIEIRGSSSQMFPKKNYTIELQTDSGTNNNVYLLGLPRENDFVLHGPYSDKSLIRNVISFEIFREMGRWAPRTRFIELYLNDDYRGIYVLMEKVKVDRYRVNITQLTAEDVTEEQISGGYILQIDRTNNLLPEEYWTTPVFSPISGFPQNTFEYYDPDFDELTPPQSSFIKNWMNNMDRMMASSTYRDPINGYRAYIDVGSFVDYLILHEFNKDVDAYRLSTYFFKAGNEQGGKLHAGPPWDYNLTFGNMNYGGDILETYNWMYPKTAGRYWWPRLMQDSYFENLVYCRWEGLTHTIMNEQWMNSLIDSCIAEMGAAIDLNFERWPVLGEYVWPNNFIGQTYASEIFFLRNWIDERLEWLNAQWNGQCIAGGDNNLIDQLRTIKISPNPSDLAYTTLHLPSAEAGEYTIAIHDLNGRLVKESIYTLEPRQSEILLQNMSYLESGIYFLRMTGPGDITFTGKLIRR